MCWTRRCHPFGTWIGSSRDLSWLDREDIRLHQPRFLTLPLSDLQGYVDAISPLVDGHLLDWSWWAYEFFCFPCNVPQHVWKKLDVVIVVPSLAFKYLQRTTTLASRSWCSFWFSSYSIDIWFFLYFIVALAQMIFVFPFPNLTHLIVALPLQ